MFQFRVRAVNGSRNTGGVLHLLMVDSFVQHSEHGYGEFVHQVWTSCLDRNRVNTKTDL